MAAPSTRTALTPNAVPSWDDVLARMPARAAAPAAPERSTPMPARTPRTANTPVHTADSNVAAQLALVTQANAQLRDDLNAVTTRVNQLQDTLDRVVAFLMRERPIAASVAAEPAASAGSVAAAEAPSPRTRVAAPRGRTTRVQRHGDIRPFLAAYPKVVATFDTMLARSMEFTDALDANLERANSAYLRDCANDYLDQYAGQSTFLVSVRDNRDRATRSVKQLRGTLSAMLGQYKDSRADG